MGENEMLSKNNGWKYAEYSEVAGVSNSSKS